jgi:hypothetical protein
LRIKKNPMLVAHTCNPSPKELRWEDSKFEAVLGNLARPYLKKTQKIQKTPEY